MTHQVWKVSTLLLLAAIGIVGLTLAVSSQRSGYTMAAHVYFVPEDQRHLLLLDVERGVSLRRSLPPDTRPQVIFSPDGNRAAIPIGGASSTELAVMTVSTGDLYATPAPYDACAVDLDTVKWSPDGRRVHFSCLHSSGDVPADGLHVIDMARRETDTLYDEDYREAQWSPEGDYLLLTSDDGLYLLDEGEPRPLLASERPVEKASWSPDGDRVAYVQDGTLYVQPIQGGEAEAPLPDIRPLNRAQWSPDGRWLAVIDSGRDSRVHTVNLAHGEAHVLGSTDVKIDRAQSLLWSPDSRLIAVQTGGSDLSTLFLSAPDGTNAREVGQRAVVPRWSPDGQYLVFTNASRINNLTGDRMQMIDVRDGDRAVSIAADSNEATWSSDAQFVSYIRLFFLDPYVAPRQLFMLRPGQNGGTRLLDDNHSVLEFSFLRE